MGMGTGLLLAAGATFALIAASAKRKPGAAAAAQPSIEQLYQGAMNAPTTDASYYQDVIQKLIKAGRPDLATGVYNAAKARGVPETSLQAAINQAAPRPAAPTAALMPVSTPTSPTMVIPDMPLALKQQVEKVIRAMGIDPTTGQVVGAATAEAVQAATVVAGTLEAAGYPLAAKQLRELAKKAATIVAANTAPAISPSVTAVIPPNLQKLIDNALKMEGDPKKLRQLAAFLRALPNASDPKIQLVIGMLEAKAAKAEQAQIANTTAQTIDNILTTSPGLPPTPTVPISVPSIPTPQPVSPPKSDRQLAADAMVRDLKRVQKGDRITSAKGNEDKSLVRRFQKLAGLSADGMAGPGTLVAAAKTGVCDMPYVMYWPRGSTKQRVYRYRDDLREVARQRAGSCVRQLEASALRERGQAGIVGPLA